MMPDRATLAALARRLEGGETGRKIDWDFAAAITGWRAEAVPFDHRSDSGVPHLTTSLDAAAALVERKRWGWVLSNEGAATLICKDPPWAVTDRVPGKPAAALVLAMVRVLIARGDAA